MPMLYPLLKSFLEKIGSTLALTNNNRASSGATGNGQAYRLGSYPNQHKKTCYAQTSQVMAIRNARRSLGERIMRTAAPHKILDPAAGPLIAVRLNIMTRKTLGGLQTDLDGRVLRADGTPLPGLYAAGEVAGFGGGGVHGYNALEGTFLGGCIFSGRAVGRALAR